MKKILNIFIILFVILCVIGCSSILDTNISSEPTNIPNEPTNIPSEPNIIDFTNMRYVAFGDSITAGGGLSSKNLSYPNMTANSLGTSITNKGVSGSTIGYDTTDNNRHCIADDVITYCKQNYKADIISFTGGSNDKGRLIPLGSINDNNTLSVYGSLNIIAKTLKERYPKAFIFFMTPIKNPTCEEPNKLNYTLNDICIAIKQVAQKYDIPVLDLYNESNFENVDCGMYAEGCDGWHPLEDYVRDYMAPLVAQFIRDNYK